MTDPVGSSFIDRVNASLDGLAVLPLAFIALLGFFVLATVVLEDTAATAEAAVELHLGS